MVKIFAKYLRKSSFSVKLLAWNMIKSRTILKANLEQNLYFAKHISMCTSNLLILNYKRKWCFLPSLYTDSLTLSELPFESFWVNLQAWNITNVYQVLVFASLSYPVLYYIILYYSILGIKGHVMPVGSHCCRVNFITNFIYKSKFYYNFITQGTVLLINVNDRCP